MSFRYLQTSIRWVKNHATPNNSLNPSELPFHDASFRCRLIASCAGRVNFYAGQGLPVPDVHEETEIFYKNYMTLVANSRRNLWPDKKDPSKGIHPARWTGRGDLFRDVEEADRVYGIEIKADLDM